MNTKNLFLKISFAIIISAAFYYAVDYYAIHNWNNTESLIVRIIDAGPENIIHDNNNNNNNDYNDNNDNNNAFQMLERDTVLKVLSGNNADEVIAVKTVRLAASSLNVVEGGRYLLVWDMFDDGRVQYSIADSFRIPSVAANIMTVCALLTALTGTRGFLALLALGSSITVLLFSFVPLITAGWNPVLLALASVLIISTVTILCVVKHARYRFVALLGSTGGVLCGFLCGALMVFLWNLSGLAGEGAALLASTFPHLNMRGVLLASVLIGSIGAVLDVGVSVTASMSELIDYDNYIPLDRLLLAGLNVGCEVLGSMINTLILAYMGSALPMAILICSAGAEFSGVLNDPYIAQEIVQSLAGTLGLLLTIPVTAFCFVMQESFRRRHD